MMNTDFYNTKAWPTKTDLLILLAALISLFATDSALCQLKQELKTVPSAKDELNLKEVPYRIVYETYRDNNWELYMVNADGSNPVNLTNSPGTDEMFAHVSGDGTKICFVADEMAGSNKTRSVYYMNIDGTGRVKVADNARQPCWSPDSKTIAYTKGEFKRYIIKDYASKGLCFYDIESRTHREHPNEQLHHIYAVCWAPDVNWFAATVHGGMGFKHAILAFEAEGNNVFDLTKYGVTGCRPDFSPDGKRLVWGATDWDLCIAEVDLKSSAPQVRNVRPFIRCEKEYEVYHTDFSPDGKYIAFSYGPEGDEKVGGKAKGWNICVSDMTGKWVEITNDGHHNKEPDWVPIAAVNH